jgi:hypothetical protein
MELFCGIRVILIISILVNLCGTLFRTIAVGRSLSCLERHLVMFCLTFKIVTFLAPSIERRCPRNNNNNHHNDFDSCRSLRNSLFRIVPVAGRSATWWCFVWDLWSFFAPSIEERLRNNDSNSNYNDFGSCRSSWSSLLGPGRRRPRGPLPRPGEQQVHKSLAASGVGSAGAARDVNK